MTGTDPTEVRYSFVDTDLGLKFTDYRGLTVDGIAYARTARHSFTPAMFDICDDGSDDDGVPRWENRTTAYRYRP